MSGILAEILCWLQSFWSKLKGLVVDEWDSLLSVVDFMLGNVDTSFMQSPNFVGVENYLWILGATGCDIAIGIVGAALVLRVTLQLIPFTRLGS